jgi:hypothetical protein
MADERDPVVSRRYRELGAEEPPRELDERILAISRRGLERRRWYGPAAIAAMLVLAVGVAVQIERKPEDAVVADAPQKEKEQEQPAAKVEAAEQAKPAPKAAAPHQFAAEPPAAPASRADEAPRELAKRNEGAAAASAPQAAPSAGASVQDRLMSKTESPEAWLERIAELRRQGKHEEADKALAEFRQRYPGYRLSDQVRAKVEKK